MKTSDFDYDLPAELIAQTPAAERDLSRLLVLDRRTGAVSHHVFREMPSFLSPGDVLALNDTRVFPARIFGRKTGTGGKVEILLEKNLGNRAWEALVNPGKRLKPGHSLEFSMSGVTAKIVDRTASGTRVIVFDYPEGSDFFSILEQIGQTPLPPYVKTAPTPAIRERYQTIYAKDPGSSAAPTAGLHFSEKTLRELDEKGVERVFVTLHIGMGTFRPVKTENVEEHAMEEERYSISPETAEKINRARREGRRVIAVGTTALRALESSCDESGAIIPGNNSTALFIYPGFKFKVVDAMITNFHLPRSTLLMLVCAFAGRENVLKAYREAVSLGYRFYSFGDACFIA